MFSENKKILRKNLPWQELDGKVVILSPETTMSHELNETSSWIWKKIEKEIVFSHLLNDLTDEFEVESDIGRKDLEEILQLLEQNSLLDG